MPRSLDDWITGYLEFTENTEPPLSYHIWTALSIISSTLQRRCFFKWGHETIYSNQYIVLIGPSGMARKASAVGIGKIFLEHVGVKTASQSITREGLIRALKKSHSNFEGADGKAKYQSTLTVVSDELAVFLGQKDIKFLADLTDWYDSHDKWEYKTKHEQAGSDTDTIVGVCVNMLGATAPDWLSSMLPQEAVGGGFTSRIIFVVEQRKGKVILDPNDYPVNSELEKKLITDLQMIKQISGPFVFDKESLEIYKDWYKKQEEDIKNGIMPVKDPKFSGYISRRQTHIKKICMCLSVSKGNSRVVTADDINRGLKILEAAEKKMSLAFSTLGKARFAALTDEVLEYIKKRGKAKRSEILRVFRRDVDSWSLEQIEKVLERMKFIKIIIPESGDDLVYRYTPIKTDHEEDQDPSA